MTALTGQEALKYASSSSGRSSSVSAESRLEVLTGMGMDEERV